MPEKQLRIIRLKMFVVTSILSLAILGAFVLAAWALEDSHAQAVRQRAAICDSANRSSMVLKNILIFAEHTALKNAKTSRQVKDIHAFYDHALSLVHPINCQGGTK